MDYMPTLGLQEAKDLSSIRCVSVSEILSFAEDGDTALHPFGFWCAFQIVIEELLETDGEVFAVAPFLEVVCLIVVFEHPNGFA